MKIKLVLTRLAMATCKEGGCLPPWYFGLSYRAWDRDCTIFHIIPLNYFIRWGMFIKHKWDRSRSKMGYVDKIIMERRASFSDCVLDTLNESAIRKEPLTWGEVKKLIGYKDEI